MFLAEFHSKSVAKQLYVCFLSTCMMCLRPRTSYSKHVALASFPSTTAFFYAIVINLGAFPLKFAPGEKRNAFPQPRTFTVLLFVISGILSRGIQLADRDVGDAKHTLVPFL